MLNCRWVENDDLTAEFTYFRGCVLLLAPVTPRSLPHLLEWWPTKISEENYAGGPTEGEFPA